MRHLICLSASQHPPASLSSLRTSSSNPSSPVNLSPLPASFFSAGMKRASGLRGFSRVNSSATCTKHVRGKFNTHPMTVDSNCQLSNPLPAGTPSGSAGWPAARLPSAHHQCQS